VALESWGWIIERYFTIKEAAALPRWHERTVWRWTVENKIEFHQPFPGYKILFPEREINRLRPRDE
jgi:excisionase family DNA binding protein